MPLDIVKHIIEANFFYYLEFRLKMSLIIFYTENIHYTNYKIYITQIINL